MNAINLRTVDAASFADRLRSLPYYLLPQRLMTRAAYRLTRIRTRWFKNLLIRGFIAIFKVNIREAEKANPYAYRDLNEFFTRSLRAEARPVAAGENIVCCPVDGSVSQAGTIAGESVFQAKGHRFSLTQLLGGDADRARAFRGGHFATLYLSPKDYHRVHMPASGYLREMLHIPGRLFSVSPLSTQTVPGLFARNERVAAFFDTDFGPMAIVLVGAINVASIETVWAGVITPPLAKSIRRWRYTETGPDSVVLAKGAEMGRFNMGSTVIVIFGENAVNWDPTIQPEARVRMGQVLGVKSI